MDPSAESKKKFYEKIRPSRQTLTNMQCEEILQKLANFANNSNVKKDNEYYRVSSKYSVIEVNIAGTYLQKLAKKGTQLLFVAFEVLVKCIFKCV